jgi:hypothetical protein
MTTTPHRSRSNFQLQHFLAGSAHTPDGAWLKLYAELVELKKTKAMEGAQHLRREALDKRLDAINKRILGLEGHLATLRANGAEEWQLNIAESEIPYAERLLLQAEVEETEAGRPIWEMNQIALSDEIAAIEALMRDLEPLRKYKHLPVLEAGEMVQQEEWKLELMRRAENYLITQGTIPHDQLDAMRLHPEFKTALVPHIQLYAQSVSIAGGAAETLSNSETFQLTE